MVRRHVSLRDTVRDFILALYLPLGKLFREVAKWVGQRL